jgi:hypothetical protein
LEIGISLRSIRVAAGLVLIVSLSSCGSGVFGTKDLSPTGSEAPVVNPHPVKLVRVFGTVDPSFSIRIFALFLSSAPQCRRLLDWWEGVYSPMGVWSESTVQRTGNRYEALVALDEYREGKCGWNPYSIAYYISNHYGVSSYGPAKGLRLPPNTGPIPFIWVNGPGKRDILVADPTHPGVQTLPTITEQCGEDQQVGESERIVCPDLSPRIIAVINEEAKEVHLNLAEWRPRQP